MNLAVIGGFQVQKKKMQFFFNCSWKFLKSRILMENWWTFISNGLTAKKHPLWQKYEFYSSFSAAQNGRFCPDTLKYEFHLNCLEYLVYITLDRLTFFRFFTNSVFKVIFWLIVAMTVFNRSDFVRHNTFFIPCCRIV